MMVALKAAMTAIFGFFGDLFEMVTAADHVEWIIFLVAVPLVFVLIRIFKNLVWGRG